jgi:hypothetical protein
MARGQRRTALHAVRLHSAGRIEVRANDHYARLRHDEILKWLRVKREVPAKTSEVFRGPGRMSIEARGPRSRFSPNSSHDALLLVECADRVAATIIAGHVGPGDAGSLPVCSIVMVGMPPAPDVP